MDATPVHRRTRSKLSRRQHASGDSGGDPADPRGVASPRVASSPRLDATFHTPVRHRPSSHGSASGADSLCWESPASDSALFGSAASPFSPLAGSQFCEVVWRDEAARRTAEALKRRTAEDDVRPPTPPQLPVESPLVPTRCSRRPSHQQRQQLLDLLDTAAAACRKQQLQLGRPVADHPTVSPDRVRQGSDPKLNAASPASPPADTESTSNDKLRGSFNSFVLEAMPEEDDDIFSQITEEEMCGGRASVSSSTAAAAPVAQCPASPRRSSSGAYRQIDTATGSSDVTVSDAKQRQVSPALKVSDARQQQLSPAREVSDAKLQYLSPAVKVSDARQQQLSPARKAEINRRRAEALRKLRQKQRMRAAASAAVSAFLPPR